MIYLGLGTVWFKDNIYTHRLLFFFQNHIKDYFCLQEVDYPYATYIHRDGSMLEKLDRVYVGMSVADYSTSATGGDNSPHRPNSPPPQKMIFMMKVPAKTQAGKGNK